MRFLVCRLLSVGLFGRLDSAKRRQLESSRRSERLPSQDDSLLVLHLPYALATSGPDLLESAGGNILGSVEDTVNDVVGVHMKPLSDPSVRRRRALSTGAIDNIIDVEEENGEVWITGERSAKRYFMGE